MTISTITQPILKADTYSELIASSGMPDRCIAWVEDLQKLYVLESGVWVDFEALSTAQLPRVWLNGTRKSNAKTVFTSASVAGGAGVVTFNIADGSAAAILANIYQEGCQFWINSSVSYNFSNFTVAADKKSLSVKVTYPIIAALAIIYSNAANGTTVYLMANGD